MVTIKDVAKLAGVSVSTVSRTISNKVFVEEETRKKVQKAIQELNYHPSGLAKGLREGKTYMLAFLVPDINSYFYPMIMKSMEHYATELGYALILCNNDECVENEKRNMNMLGSRGIDGLVCMSVSDDISHLEQFGKERGIPVVLVNRSVPKHMSSVSFDNEYGGYLMAKYLLDKGHRKIAGMFGNLEKERFRERYSGCIRAMKEYGIADCEKYFIYDVNTVEDACAKTKTALAGADRPTAIFAAMDIMAVGIYKGINESGLRIPEDISVVGFDNIFMAQYMCPALTTYDVSMDMVAREAIDCIMAQISEPETTRHINFKGEVIERCSVKTL